MATERVVADLGRKLREARERRNLTLHQIAERTKISAVVLEGLERNDISKLPGGIFGRAFVRTFAGEIGLDPEATLQEFILQFPQDSVTVGHPRPPQSGDSQAPELQRRVGSTVLRRLGLAVPIAVGVIYLSTQRGTGPVATPRMEVAGLARSAAAGSADTSLRNAVTDTAMPAPPVVAPAADETLTVALKVTRPGRISAIVDGETEFDGPVKPGEQRTLRARRELLLTTGDASGVEMVVNGIAAKPLGGKGEAVTKRLTPENVEEFLPTRDWPAAPSATPARAADVRPAGRGGSDTTPARRSKAVRASRAKTAGDARTARRASRAARPAAAPTPR